MNIWKNRNFVPMLLDEQKEPFDSKEYLFEIKYDGIRAIVFASPERVIIQSRKKLDITHLYPELQSIKKLVKYPTIFDGEIVCFNEKGYPSFSRLQERSHLKNKSKIEHNSKNNPAIYVCFDILYSKSDVTDLPLLERKSILSKISDNDFFNKVMYILGEGTKLFKNIKLEGLEGIVAKRKDSKYEINIRSKNWIKIKNFKYGEFLICGYYEEEKNYVFTAILAEKFNNELKHVGNVSIAKKNKLYDKIKKTKTINTSLLKNYKNNEVKYITKQYKVKIEYLERTPNDHLRQPVFVKEINE